MNYFVYMVICADRTIYTGYTTNLLKRVEQHNKGNQGARYTRTRRPVKLAYVEIFASQKDAMKREIAIKKLSKIQKQSLIEKYRKKQYNAAS
ncbi:MAG: GIY-YIG nuclease family protein [Asgard group archaeon]|nr:GIY-YIG nuclease family protein [Asgard group archaeon]